MEHIRKLNAILRLYRDNFSVLHWNCVGEEFSDAHVNISSAYEELCGKYIDVTAEMVTRLGGNPCNYESVINELIGTQFYVVIDSTVLYSRLEVIKASQVMLSNVCESIALALDSEILKSTLKAGIKSNLESILDEFDIQANYVNCRRLGGECTKNAENDAPIPVNDDANNNEDIESPLDIEDEEITDESNDNIDNLDNEVKEDDVLEEI